MIARDSACVCSPLQNKMFHDETDNDIDFIVFDFIFDFLSLVPPSLFE